MDLEGGETVRVSGHESPAIPKSPASTPGLQRPLNFYRLACTAQYETDGSTPLIGAYQATMLEWGGQKLTELRHRMPDAGGLVIAPTIEMAEYMVALIELLVGERPMLVHSQSANAEGTTKAFRNTDMRWLVSVAMVSEGVDIRRLRVLVCLPSELTDRAGLSPSDRTRGALGWFERRLPGRRRDASLRHLRGVCSAGGRGNVARSEGRRRPSKDPEPDL